MSDEAALFKIIKDAMDSGGSGVAVGRNAFGHASPVKMTRAITALVHQGASIEDALRIIRE